MADPMLAAAERASTLRKVLMLGGKFAITCACFWYVFRQIRIRDLLDEASTLDSRWLILAAIFMVVQSPLVGIRWARITDALEPELPPTPRGAMIAITMISGFFAQIVPNVMSDALRIWLLSRIRPGWRMGLAGVAIDRGVGVGVLLAIGLVTLINVSAFTTLLGYRQTILLIFAALLAGGIGGLVGAPIYARVLSRYRATKWIGEFALASRQVLIESPAAVSIVAIAIFVHLLTIADIWSLGIAFSMPLSLIDAAVLFTLMVAIALIPISVSGWGLRELAVTAFLNSHGIPSQRALLFSICFGLTLVAAALPGAVVLMFYSPAKAQRRPR